MVPAQTELATFAPEVRVRTAAAHGSAAEPALVTYFPAMPVAVCSAPSSLSSQMSLTPVALKRRTVEATQTPAPDVKVLVAAAHTDEAALAPEVNVRVV